MMNEGISYKKANDIYYDQLQIYPSTKNTNFIDDLIALDGQDKSYVRSCNLVTPKLPLTFIIKV